MADVIYNSYAVDLGKADVDFLVDTIKVALVTSSYTPDQDTHDFYDDITNEVANGNGYTTGGATLANKSVTKDNVNNRSVLDADDTAWTTSSFTARGAVIYKDTGVASTSPLICYKDFGSDKTVSSGTFTISWNAAGILTINS